MHHKGDGAMDKNAIAGQKDYQRMVQSLKPKPCLVKDVARAFLVGGSIALIGQAAFMFFTTIEPTRGEAVSATLAAMIALGGILTSLGVYDIIAEWGGAGAAIPITGFANTIVAAAMDFRREGYILGLGAKMFIIAGPIIVYGIVSGFVVALLKLAVQAILG